MSKLTRITVIFANCFSLLILVEAVTIHKNFPPEKIKAISFPEASKKLNRQIRNAAAKNATKEMRGKAEEPLKNHGKQLLEGLLGR